jgi:hypothetical protein
MRLFHRLMCVTREGVLNLLAYPMRSTAFILVLAGILVGPALFDAMAVTALNNQADEFRKSGGAIRVLTAPGSVTREQCEHLVRTAGFTSSGSVEKGASVTLRQPGLNALPVYEVSPGFAKLLGIEHRDVAGVYLSASFASELGTAPGKDLVLSDGVVLVQGVFELPVVQGAAAALNTALIVVVPAVGESSQCWAEIWPTTQELDPYLLNAATPDAPKGETTIDPLNSSLGQQFNGYEIFSQRPTRFLAYGATVVVFSLGIFFAGMRRLEIASSLHAGAKRSFAMGVIIVEALPIGIASLALSFTCGVTLDRQLGLAGGLAFPLALWAVQVALFVGGCALVCSIVQEKTLFALFKNR